jgi:hypothetical protein
MMTSRHALDRRRHAMQARSIQLNIGSTKDTKWSRETF